MNEHSFQVRLICNYEGDDNSIADLVVELLADGQWEQLDLNLRTSGFLLFVYTLFTCQHTYMRTNCAERGLTLETTQGSIDIVASEDWVLQKMHLRFDGKLRSGIPTPGDVEYIVSRMEQCPVSKNIHAPTDSVTSLYLE